ncbi:MAG: rod shape-determining protein MreB [Oscillospiraceae bacterium]|nr:rod shape-determining protein MreB [Oscillospiraceae bacterium]
MGKDIGIDLGTASVLVYVKGKGIIFKEPSVVAMDKSTGKILKVGREAQLMLGRTPTNIMAIRPLREGVINDYGVTLKMLQHFIRRACGNLLFKPRVMICVPSGITEVEERAVVDAATQAGAKKTYLIEEPLAAAIGAGIDIHRPNGNMVIDIGGGTTDVAVISLGAVVTSKSIKVAGDKFDEAIIKNIKRKYNLVIGERTAEDIKMKIGCVWPREETKIMSVKGRCTIEGLPKVLQINSSEIEEAMQEPAASITEIVRMVLENTPPELVGDISTNGIVMTGGGSLIYGFDKLLASITGINAWVAEDPISCVAIGTGRSLEDKYIKYLPEGVINISRNRQQ